MSLAPEAVLFDLDETLCEPRTSIAEVLDGAFADVGVDPFFAAHEDDDIAERYMDEYEAKAGWRAHCFADLAERHGHDRAVGFQVAEAYAERRSYDDSTWVPGAKAVLDALDGRYHLALVTNGEPAMQDPKIGALALRPYFESIVYAGIETAAKPDPEPLEVALDALSVRPDDALYVGNSLESDVQVPETPAFPWPGSTAMASRTPSQNRTWSSIRCVI